MELKKESIEKSITDALLKIQEEGLINDSVKINNETVLYGTSGCLSSLNLIALIVDLEELFLRDFNVSLNLVDEKMFSLKNSPLHTISTLTDYIYSSVNESK